MRTTEHRELPRTARDRLTEAVLLFLPYAVIGWLYEVGLAFLYGYGFVNRGFLCGPWLPLYGFGALLLIACLQGPMRRELRIGPLPVTGLAVFGWAVLLTTALEYAVGWLLEALFDQRFWDYSTYQYQLHGRICLSASIRFGLGSLLFLYVLLPLFRRGIGCIPPQRRRTLAVCLLILLAADLVFTLCRASTSGFDPTLAQPR